MLRVIRLTQPTWVIAENVRGLLTLQQGVVFEQVCLDLESSGYEVQPFIIPAVAVNAPHRRDRVWFVAYRTGDTTNSFGERLERSGTESKLQEPAESSRYPEWTKDWLEVATELCSLDDGLPAELGDFTLTKAQNRVQQLKAYGNAIVPQIAIEIMKGIKL